MGLLTLEHSKAAYRADFALHGMAVLGLPGWLIALCFAAGVALPPWALFNESGTTCSGRRGRRVPWMRARRGRVARSVRAHRPAAPTRTRPTKLGALSDRRDPRLFLR